MNSHLGSDTESSVSRSLSDANETIFDNRDTVVGDIREVRPICMLRHNIEYQNIGLVLKAVTTIQVYR